MAIKSSEQWDVVVVGGGPAGIGAAVAAARNGARTLLVEQAAFLGGCLTMGYPMNGMFSLDGTQVVNGIPEELFQRVVSLEGSAGHVEVHNSWLRTYDLMDAEVVKYVAQEMVLEAGGQLLLHALTVDALVEDNRVTGVVIAGKGGLEIIRGRVVIDCSGDADVAARAGAPYQKGRERDGQMQAVTLMFRLNRVDTARLPEHFPQGIAYAVKPGSTEPSFLRGAGNFQRWEREVLAEGVLDRANHAIFTNSLRDGEFAANTTRVIGIDATDTWDLTRAEIEGRRQVMRMVGFFRRHLPGFERASLIATGPFIGVRETRRIIGEYVLTEDDVVEARDFPDNIARGEYPVDIHIPDGSGIYQRFVRDGGSYGIPYRCLVPLKVDGLLAAGRCISATHEAIGSAREMGQCMAMGQAAGAAAALALRQGVNVRDVDIGTLRTTLRAQGAVLEVSDAPCRLGSEPKEVMDPGVQML